MARITVKTLAAAVGVSPSTVSNAYNRPDQLSAVLRQRILAKADELGYAGPDAAGRTLRVGRADAVGVLLSERLSYAFSDPYVIELLTGLSEVAERRAISIVLMPLAADSGEHDLRSVRQASIDAMALLSMPADHPAAQLARTRGIRLVTTDPEPGPGDELGGDRRRRGRSPGRPPPGRARPPRRDRAGGDQPAGRQPGPPAQHPAGDGVRLLRAAARAGRDHPGPAQPAVRWPQLLRLRRQRRQPPGRVRAAAHRGRRAERRHRPRRALGLHRARAVRCPATCRSAASTTSPPPGRRT